jgi:hypothetical protein
MVGFINDQFATRNDPSIIDTGPEHSNPDEEYGFPLLQPQDRAGADEEGLAERVVGLLGHLHAEAEGAVGGSDAQGEGFMCAGVFMGHFHVLYVCD